MDEDGSGEIDFQEFLLLMRNFMDESDADTLRKEKECVAKSGFNVEEVKLWRDIFSKFDADGNGQYDMGETKKLLQAVGTTGPRATRTVLTQWKTAWLF